MKRYKMIFPALIMMALSACEDEPDGEDFVGRWAHEKSKQIIQIDPIDGSNLKVSRTMLWGNTYQTSEFTGSVDGDGGLTSGIGRFVLDPNSGYLVTDGGNFVPAPEGWMPRDGRDKLLK